MKGDVDVDIFVILKQTFDTEEKISIQDGKVLDEGVKYVINPYDEYAIEEALRLREYHGGGKVTVLSVGPARTAEALRTALAMGADEAVHIEIPEHVSLDEAVVAKLIGSFLKNLTFDLILGGNFSVDSGAGQVAVRLARRLGLPHTSSITKLTVNHRKATVIRDAEGDTETVEVDLPALFTAQQGLNEPRYPSLPGIMKAKKKPFTVIDWNDLGWSDTERLPYTERTSLSLPTARQAGTILKGSPGEQAQMLVQLLQSEAKII